MAREFAPRERRVRALSGVGVVCRLIHPSVADLVEQAQQAEEAGADWMVFPDNLGWHDVWMALMAAGAATARIRLGPAVSNPYTRHPLVTMGAVATLYDAIGDRVLLGVGAGGSELLTHAGIDRLNAPEQVRAMVSLIRRTAAGERTLPMSAAVPDVPLLGAARKRQMTEAVADTCDAVLLSGQVREEMIATAGIVDQRGAAIVWSPMLAADDRHLPAGIVYGLLNAPVGVRRRLGVDAQLEVRLKASLAAEGTGAAAKLVPASAVAAFMTEAELAQAQSFARDIAVCAVAVQAFDTEHLAERVQWARSVVAGLNHAP